MKMTSAPRFRLSLNLKAFTYFLAMSVLLAVATPVTAWENLLEDPGFERFRLNPKGYYEPTEDSAWQEITFGRASIRVDMNDWEAPPEMLAEGKLGFTPCTLGFEGQGPEENTGIIILQQDLTDSTLFEKKDQLYEAWFWLGGAGRDDDNNADMKEEHGRWEIFFYDNNDPSTWKGKDPLQSHSIAKDFFGEHGTFVRVHGYGKIPEGTKGMRMRISAQTWGQGSGPRGFDTEVAIDNAHFGLIQAPNMLLNGDFELDDRVAEFKGWSRPATWPFPRNGLKPLDVNDVFEGSNFDHGKYRPFYGARRSYGYATYLSGWRKDAFTFGQYVDNPYPDGTPMMLLFNWIQAPARGAEWELRLIGTRIETVVDYLDEDDRQLGAESQWHQWPLPTGAAAVGRYDQNSARPYCPRVLLNPPDGTKRIGVHVNFMVHAPYRDGFKSINAAVDDFFLGPAEAPAE